MLSGERVGIGASPTQNESNPWERAEQKGKSAKRTDKERSGQNGKEAAVNGVWKARQRTLQEEWGSDPADPSRISY